MTATEVNISRSTLKDRLMSHYLALLRGINVGGKNIIKMNELKACFEALGFVNVRTYIQSGNVLFSAKEPDQLRLTSQIEDALSETFDYDLRVVIRSDKELEEIVAQAPRGFGSELATFRYDVIFLMKPLTSTEVMQSVTVKEGVDRAYTGNGVLYFSRLINKASQSYLSRIVSMSIYQSMTIRNWNTTTRLLKMIRADDK